MSSQERSFQGETDSLNATKQRNYAASREANPVSPTPLKRTTRKKGARRRTTTRWRREQGRKKKGEGEWMTTKDKVSMKVNVLPRSDIKDGKEIVARVMFGDKSRAHDVSREA